MGNEELLYSIALRRSKNIGEVHFQKLISILGSAKAVWTVQRDTIREILEIKSRLFDDIGNDQHLIFAEKELLFCEKNNIRPLLRHLGQLPGWLGECDDAPAILYTQGTIPTRAQFLSIVGTRNMTLYGKNFLHNLFQSLSSSPSVYSISGLALGVDTEVHLQSLQNKIPTMAVLAHGLHTLYPHKNKKLAEKILENGGSIITEFNSGQKPDRKHFIQRNRIIAGISANTIVVETAFGGGSISTVNFANNYNRDVYALPGKIDDKYSQGCNMLIGQNRAKAIYSISDLMVDLDVKAPKSEIGNLFDEIKKSNIPLTPLQKKIYHSIQTYRDCYADEIALRLEMRPHDLIAELLQMEILGLIQSNSSKQYRIE